MQKTPTDRTLLAPLHGLRGIAVLFVVLSHLGYAQLFLFPLPHYSIGKVGVWIFFALSAYLLTANLCRDLSTSTSRPITLLEYFIHRIFRIYPLLITVLLIHLLIGDMTETQVIMHLFLKLGFQELWAIPVEFQYYFVIPIIALGYLLLPRKALIAILTCLLGLALLYGMAYPRTVFSNQLDIFPKLTPFLLGSMLALLQISSVRNSNTVSQATDSLLTDYGLICLLVVLTIAYWLISRRILDVTYAPWVSFFLGLTASGLIFSAIHPQRRLAKLLGSAPLVFLGKISFSIYLLHMFVIKYLPINLQVPVQAKAWITLATILLISAITYHILEVPGMRTGKWLSNKLIALRCITYKTISQRK